MVTPNKNIKVTAKYLNKTFGFKLDKMGDDCDVILKDISSDHKIVWSYGFVRDRIKTRKFGDLCYEYFLPICECHTINEIDNMLAKVGLNKAQLALNSVK